MTPEENVKLYTERTEWFLERMRYKLSLNTNKGSWRDNDLFSLFELLKKEVKELELEVGSFDNDNIIKECADVANFAMMVADLAATKSKNELVEGAVKSTARLLNEFTEELNN